MVKIGKTGKHCPFREGHICGDVCGLFCVGLKSCVFHAINKNLMDLKEIFDRDEVDKEEYEEVETICPDSK